MTLSTCPTDSSPRRFVSSSLILLVICLSVSFAVYVLTLAPTVYTFDSAEFATGAFCLGIIHPTGYPFYLLLAKLFTFLPVGDVAYRVNLMSAVFGAITVALLFVLCVRITRDELISASAALLFAFSHFFWREAIIAETYTLNTALVLIILLVLLRESGSRRALAMSLAGLIFGVALSNHMSSILLIPALAFWAIVQRAYVRHIFLFGIAAAIGLAFYLYLPIRYLADPPLNYAAAYLDTNLTTVPGVLEWISGETFRQFMLGYNVRELLGEFATYITWLWSNFLGAGVLIGLVGIIAMARENRKQLGLFAAVYLAYTVFFVNYRVVNKDTMFSVSYVIWTVWLAYGGKTVATWIRERGYPRLVGPVFMACVALAALLANYASVDQSHNTMARDFAGQLLGSAAPSAFIVTEWTWATPLEYLQIVELRRPDVTIYDRGLAGLGQWSKLRRQGVPDSQALQVIENTLATVIHKQLATRPVYATEYDETLARQFEFISLGRYYRLRARPALGMLP